MSTFTVFMHFPKKRVNFTRSSAFAQKVKFYALQMLKIQNLTHPKAAKLATLDTVPHDVLLSKLKHYFYMFIARLARVLLEIWIYFQRNASSV